MTNFFTFAANEATSGSIFYLGSIFGTVGTVLTGTGPALLPTMFKVFNTAVLAIGTIIITYTAGMGVLLTAQEGEMLGKKFHALWVPMRTVFGLSALIPASTGYSYLQIALMWFILQGVGAADTLWTATVNYINAGGTTAPANPQTAAKASSSVKNDIGMLFEGLVCQAAERANGISTPGYFCTTPGNQNTPFCTSSSLLTINTANASYPMGVNGDCGSLTLGGTDAIGTAQNNAYLQIVPLLGAIATQLVTMDNAYSNFISPSAVNPTAPSFVQSYCATAGGACTPEQLNGSFPAPSMNPFNMVTVTGLYWPYALQSNYGDFITTASNLYANMVGSAYSTTQSSNATAIPSQATDNGWIFAGAYFYQIAQINRTANGATAPTVTAPNTADIQANLLYNEGVNLVNHISSLPATSTSATVGLNIRLNLQPISISIPLLPPIIIPVDQWMQDIVDSWITSLSGSGSGAVTSTNPVVAAQNCGHIMLATVGAAYPALLLLNSIAGAAMGATILGTGTSGVAIVVDMLLLPPLFFFAGIFLGLGATLAIYTPMIPYMLFAFGGINWLIATIETMIAAPILAIGLLYPEGGHDLWGKTEAAINLLLNIFLRPSLMIFGFIAALLMSYVAITYINSAFLAVASYMTSGWGYLEVTFFMVLYTTFFITVLNKCFELIHIIPDRILRWIGGGHEQFGDSGMDKVSQGFQSGVQKAEQAGGAKPGGAMGEIAKQRAHKAEKRGAGGGTIGNS